MSHLQESIYLADVVTQVRKGEERGMERGRGRERERERERERRREREREEIEGRRVGSIAGESNERKWERARRDRD